jgi:hypothetical protein
MKLIKYLLIVILTIPPFVTQAQVKTYPVESRNSTTTSKPHARIQSFVEPLLLPFWDDFSFTTTDYPVDSLWEDGRQILVSSGQGINPPTLNVATFDGLDDNGVPYTQNPNDVLDFGYRDMLVSQPINLDTVEAFLRNSVYLSFYYQWGGNGEPPDPNDFLRIEFKGENGWDVENQITIQTTGDNFSPDVFYDTIIQINKSEYFHKNFQFRFISFGRKTGRYDAWHVDYVYLNKGRDKDDRYRPDRATTTKLSPLFDKYYAVPITHFENGKEVTSPTFQIYNLNNEPTIATYSIKSNITTYKDGTSTLYETNLGEDLDIGDNATFEARTRKTVTVLNLPDPDDNNQFDFTADSILVKLGVTLFAGDVIKRDGLIDYDSARHYPIDFRTNDTTSQVYTLKNYYAYDDGTAEYAVGLTQAGNYLAYRFDMKTNASDILNGVFIHYPYYAGTAPSIMEFFIFSDNNGTPGNPLYEQLVPVMRTANNTFIEISFFEGVPVQGSFFIGYKEPATGRVRIGLDKSHDTTNRLYYKTSTNASWNVSDRVYGSLMIRPRFGEAEVISGLPEAQKPFIVYPNPSQGKFYLSGKPTQLTIVNLAGQPVNFTTVDLGENFQITTNATAGIYILRYQRGNNVFTEKIIIQ